MSDEPISSGLGPPAAAAGAPLDVVLAGAGERARAWLAVIDRSPRLQLVATVARGDEVLAEVPRYRALEKALEAHPAAAVAVALPPLAGLEAALLLAGQGRSGIVEAPLDDALIDAALGPGAAGVRVAHGWVTLPGRKTVEAIMKRAGGGRLRIDVAGLPERAGGDLGEVVVHAAALVRALLPGAIAVAAGAADGGLTIELTAGGGGVAWTAELRVGQRGRRLAVRVESSGDPARWRWEDERESVTLGARTLVAQRTPPPAEARALGQLLGGAAGGDGLIEAAAALRLARSCRLRLPTRMPPGARPFRQSAAIAARRPTDLLGRLGLRGELPLDRGPVPAEHAITLPPEPLELWAFRAGVKPVAFLTVRPEDAERTLAHFGEVAHERRERRVRIDAQDRWVDRREDGEPRVELYIARDPELARRAAHLQAEVDPTRAVAELGALVGYPPCCVAAFAAQDDRANNSRNRYWSHARTLAPDGSTTAPWPWELNNLDAMLLAFYPCSYRCAAALEQARHCLQEMATVHPAIVAGLQSALARPVLYFDHEHQVVFDGAWSDGGVSYRGVAVRRSASPQLMALATALGRGNRVLLDERALLVERDGVAELRLERTDPALGFIAPFG